MHAPLASHPDFKNDKYLNHLFLSKGLLEHNLVFLPKFHLDRELNPIEIVWPIFSTLPEVTVIAYNLYYATTYIISYVPVVLDKPTINLQWCRKMFLSWVADGSARKVESAQTKWCLYTTPGKWI